MDNLCPTCGSPVNAEQAGGLCPNCLAAMAVRSSAPLPPENPLVPGQVFHGFEVVGFVARGGMGIVYRARRAGSPRDFALKILPRALGVEAEFRRRFDREARALLGLNHPNIVNVFDFGVEGDLMFLVMEFVEGVSLRQQLRGGKRVPPARAFRIASDLCGALDFAHRQGVVHRDLKPDNVLVDPTDHVKLTDFGLAKQSELESTHFTQSNLVIGTPHYMSPEQLERPKEVDHRADIYSMGVLLYEMLTGELPIGRFPSPSDRIDVPASVDALVLRCLEKEPDARFASIAALKAAIQEHLALATPPPTPARRPTPGSREMLCTCGADFLVPAAARGLVHCPRCGQAVQIGGPTPLPAPAAPPTARKASATLAIRLPVPLLASGAGLLVLIAVLLVVLLSPPSPLPLPEEIAPLRRPTEIAQVPPPVAGTPSPVAATPPKPGVDIPALQRRVEALIAEANLSGIIGTILLYSGRRGEHDQLQARIAQGERELYGLASALRQVGKPAEIPERFRSGDRIAVFGATRVEPLKTLAFAEELRFWIRRFQPGVHESVIVTRDREETRLTMSFPERTLELEAIARQAGLGLGEAAVALPSPVPNAPWNPLPAAPLAESRRRYAALHPYYRAALPADDRRRAEALFAAGTGSSDDAQFLERRLPELLAKGETEQALLPLRIKEALARLDEEAATTSTIHFKDGRRVEGTVLENTPDFIKIKGRFGAMTESQASVLRIDRGRASTTEFRARYDAAKAKPAELQTLISWCRDRGLGTAKELCAWTLLSINPGDDRARAELSLPAPSGAAPLPGASGIEFQGRIFKAEQLRQELRSLGHVQVGGLWCEKVSRSVKIDNLYRDESKLSIRYTATGILSLIEKSDSTVYDIQSKSWVPVSKRIAIARYIGGSGTCTIEIAAPGEFLEARVRARAQVQKSGGVTVSVEGRSGVRTLFTLNAPGENDSSHDVSDVVTGGKSFSVRAELRGDGMFLPSDSNDLGVFEVKYVYARPLDKVNASLSLSTGLSVEAREDELKAMNDQAETRIRAAAILATTRPGMLEAIGEMRAQTDDVVYLRDYVVPARFSDVAALIKDPLQPDWKGLTREQGTRLGAWWGALPAAERQDFLAAYGFWCARARQARAR